MVNQLLRRFGAIATIAVFICSTTGAYAQSEASGREEFEKGARFYKAQEYEAALPWFQKAYELSNHRPTTVRALAQCERSLKMYKEAIKHFQEYLDSKPPEKDAKSVRETIALLEELETYKVEKKPEPAEQTPSLDAPPVVTEKPKKKHVKKEERKEEIRVEETVKQEPAETPIIEQPKEIDLAPPQPTTPPITQTDTMIESDSDVLPWVAIGGSSAVAIAGIALLAIGNHDLNRVENAPDGTPYQGEIADAADRAPVLTGLGTGLLIAGIAGAGASVAWLLAGDDEPEFHTATTISMNQSGGSR